MHIDAGSRLRQTTRNRVGASLPKAHPPSCICSAKLTRVGGQSTRRWGEPKRRCAMKVATAARLHDCSYSGRCHWIHMQRRELASTAAGSNHGQVQRARATAPIAVVVATTTRQGTFASMCANLLGRVSPLTRFAAFRY